MNNDAPDAVVEAPDTTQTAPSPENDSGAQREEETRNVDAVNDHTTGAASDHPANEHDRESAAELERRKDFEAFAELCARRMMEKLNADGGYRKAVDRLCGKMDSVCEKMDSVCEKMNGVCEKLDGVCEKLDGVGKKLDGVCEKLDGVSEKLDGVSEKLDGVSEKLDGACEKLDGVRGNMDGVRESIECLRRGVEGFERKAEERQRLQAERERKFEQLMEKLRISRLEQERTIGGVWAAYDAQNASPPVRVDFHTIVWPVLRPPKCAPPQIPDGPPVVAGLTRSAIREFLLSPAHSTGLTPRARIQTALRRWHPDKMSRVIESTVERDRAAVEEGVKVVAGELAVLLKEVSEARQA